MIAIKADVTDARRRHKFEEAVEQALPGPQDRDKDELLAAQGGCLHRAERRLDRYLRHVEITQHLVAEQQRYLPQKLTEDVRWRLFIPHQ